MNDLTKKIEKQRAKIKALADKRTALSQQLLSQEETHTKIKSFVEQQARSSTFDLTGFATSKHTPTSWPAIVAGPGTSDPMPAANIAPVIALLMPDLIVKRLTELTDDAVGGRYGMPKPKRLEEVARIDSEILDLEIEEEGYIRVAESSGVNVNRRHDIENPIVVALKELKR